MAGRIPQILDGLTAIEIALIVREEVVGLLKDIVAMRVEVMKEEKEALILVGIH
jgi:hypothetical protein